MFRFGIKGTKDASVVERGVRAQIYTIASHYKLQGLKAAPVNVTDVKNSRVDVLVSAGEDVFGQFYGKVVDYARKLGPGVEVTTPDKYEGWEPDWMEYREDFNTEQLAKGIEYLQRFAEHFGKFSEGVEKIGKGVDELLRKPPPK